MPRFAGSLARVLDFGDTTTTAIPSAGAGAGPQRRPRLAYAGLRGPDKYEALERRRRQAQMRARHLLELMDGRHAAS